MVRHIWYMIFTLNLLVPNYAHGDTPGHARVLQDDYIPDRPLTFILGTEVAHLP